MFPNLFLCVYRAAISLRELMSHRSGVVREPPLGHYFDPEPRTLEQVVRSLSSTSLVFEPGTRTKYSNAGVTVVGAAVEKVAGEPFAAVIDRALFRPIGMSRSSFEPGPELARNMAHGTMWTYDGQTIATPAFRLGTGPAGNLVSSVTDLGRFLSFLFAGGSAGQKSLLKPETLKAMIEPQLGKPGSRLASGWASRSRSSGTSGGSATAVQSMASRPNFKRCPTPGWARSSLPPPIVPTVSPNTSLRPRSKLLLAIRRGEPLPALESTTPIPTSRLIELAGHYAHDKKTLDLVDGRETFPEPLRRAKRVEVRSLGNALVVDDRLAFNRDIAFENGRLSLGGESYEKQPDRKPERLPLDGTI